MPVDFRIRHSQKSELDEFKALLGRAAAELPKEAFQEGGEAFRKLMAEYPPPRPGSSYVRTGTLARGWRVNASPTMFRARNDVSYAVYVQGSYRRWFHKDTGWRTPREVWNQRGEVVKVQLRRSLFKHWQKRRL